MTLAFKVMKTITKYLMYVSCVATLVLLVMTVASVVIRYIFGIGFIWVTEWSQMMLIIAMTAMSRSLLEGRFVSVGAVVDNFPKKANLAIEILMGALAIVFFLIVGVQFIIAIEMAMVGHSQYFVIKVVKWPMYAVMGVSFLACAMATIVYVVERIKNYVDPKSKTVFDENPDLAILALTEDKV